MVEERDPTSRTRRQEKNSRMDTSSRTKSVERPVRAVDLFIASLDALTLLEGSSTLSARIDSDERATLLASFGWPVCTRQNERRTDCRRENERKRERDCQWKTETSHRADGKKKEGCFDAGTREKEEREEREKRRADRFTGGFLEYLAVRLRIGRIGRRPQGKSGTSRGSRTLSLSSLILLTTRDGDDISAVLSYFLLAKYTTF